MDKLLSTISIVMILLMSLAIFIQVLTRYIFHISLPYLHFIIVLSISWLTMIGSAIGLKTKEHFAITIFSETNHGIVARICFFLRECAVFTVIIIFCISGYRFLQIGLMKEDPSTGFSEAFSYSSILIGAICMLIYFVKEHFLDKRRGL